MRIANADLVPTETNLRSGYSNFSERCDFGVRKSSGRALLRVRCVRRCDLADIDEVLERLVTDTGFRSELERDPAAALAGYSLTESELQLLASSLDSGDDAQRGVEQRTSKSAVVGLLASLSGGGGRPDAGVHKHIGNVKWSGREVPGKGTTAPDDAARMLGRPKVGEISVSRDMAPGSGDAPDEEALRKLPGKPKPGEITLTRTASGTTGPGEDALHVKLTNNTIKETLAPPSASSPDDGTHIKFKNDSISDRLAPPSTGGSGEDALLLKHPPWRDHAVERLQIPAEDFLTIEDA